VDSAGKARERVSEAAGFRVGHPLRIGKPQRGRRDRHSFSLDAKWQAAVLQSKVRQFRPPRSERNVYILKVPKRIFKGLPVQLYFGGNGERSQPRTRRR
jgi:hypothetical protein